MHTGGSEFGGPDLLKTGGREFGDRGLLEQREDNPDFRPVHVRKIPPRSPVSINRSLTLIACAGYLAPRCYSQIAPCPERESPGVSK